MATHVEASDALRSEFHELKRKGSPRFMTMKIESSSVVVDQRGGSNGSSSELVQALPSSECRFGVYDHRGTDNDGCSKSKLVFIVWSPDEAPVKQKMRYTSAKNIFKETLDGVQMELQATDPSELSESTFKQKAGF